jgi:DNA-binding winged helix-turn-helix (wHTH) protein
MTHSFDAYTLDAERYELVQSGGLLPVEPRVLDVLASLVQHPGRTVTTEELLAQLYPHQGGTDDGPTNAMERVRECRHDVGRTQRHIQTGHRRGYPISTTRIYNDRWSRPEEAVSFRMKYLRAKSKE